MSKTKQGTAGRAARLRPTSPAEACEILQSAIAYMQAAGFAVRAGNRDAGLVFVVPGAEIVMTDAGTTIRLSQHDAGTGADAGMGADAGTTT